MKKLLLALAFLPLLLGAAVNQQSKSVSLTTFGADPTGVADAYASFTAALNSGATQIVVPPGQYLLAGAGTVALNNVEIECKGAPAQYNTPPTIGTTGTTFLLTSTTVQPFTVQGGVRIKGCNFFWPNQTGTTSTPTAYPPLFTEPVGHQLNSFELISDRIINAYDVLDQASTADFFGAIQVNNTIGYAIRYWFQLASVSEWITVTGFWADAGLYQTVAMAGPNYYLFDWTAANGAFLHVFGNGNGSTVGSSVNVSGFLMSSSGIFGYNKFVWVDSTGAFAESKFNIIYDGVPRVLEVDAGGCIEDVEFDGAYYSYQAVAPTFATGGADNAPTFSISTPPTSICGTNGVRISGHLFNAQGDFIDLTDSGNVLKAVSVNVSGGGPFGATSTAGTYYFAKVNGAGIVFDAYGNHVEAAAAHQGSPRLGFDPVNCLTCTVTGNSFNGVYNAVLVGGTAVKATGTGNVATGTPTGGTPVVGTGDFAHQLLSGNSWDHYAQPAISACGTGPTLTGNSSDISGTVGVGTGATTSCTITFANAWFSIPRCYVSGIQAAAQPVGVSVTTAALVVTSTASMASNTIFYRCDAGW